MKDLVIRLKNQVGALADMGEALAEAGISVEGGGAWVVNNEGIAHFLVEDGKKARQALEEKGIEVIKENEILVQRLKQDQPGQLGKITRAMQKAGVNIEVLYSDHDNRLILVVDDYEKGKVVSNNWTQGVYA
ncbi:amino acid-binding ACT domain-containing protein [Fulvivirga ulvae]|uniref:amino acid-binding ACT domain-containing protein n=1 Tax=Fulvivirga ulvae TaxID=2904245 RepID=UPI001F16634D|nr:amino acid-binding ACT domain-containing protein [Fulvivirga ulvae]UII32863.1 amino acid-binding ACT domain-containing protein [Fulvivirga ulvae]